MRGELVSAMDGMEIIVPLYQYPGGESYVRSTYFETIIHTYFETIQARPFVQPSTFSRYLRQGRSLLARISSRWVLASLE